MGIFTEDDFEIHEDYALCPNRKVLNRKPKMTVRRVDHEWRYQANERDCEGCPLRAGRTTGKGPRTLGVNGYRGDLVRLRKRMEAIPEFTRDPMARLKALVEGMVNVLRWHKIRHGALEDLKERRARGAVA